MLHVYQYIYFLYLLDWTVLNVTCSQKSTAHAIWHIFVIISHKFSVEGHLTLFEYIFIVITSAVFTDFTMILRTSFVSKLNRLWILRCIWFIHFLSWGWQVLLYCISFFMYFFVVLLVIRVMSLYDVWCVNHIMSCIFFNCKCFSCISCSL